MTIEIRMREAFLAALMLTGTAEAAERAVWDAIATSGCGLSGDELLVATARCATQLRVECLPQADIPSSLPPELRRLFPLSSVDRKCLVLRMLMGLTPEMSSGILNLHRDEVDEALSSALIDLARLTAIQTDLACTAERALKSGEAARPTSIQ